MAGSCNRMMKNCDVQQSSLLQIVLVRVRVVLRRTVVGDIDRSFHFMSRTSLTLTGTIEPQTTETLGFNPFTVL